MPESLETRLRQALDAEPHADPQRADEARAAALAALPHRPSRAPRSSRRRMVRVLVPLAAAACAAAGLIAIMPRGQKPAAPAGPAPEDVISLLRTGTPVDAATLHLPASGLGFPQVDMSSLRAVPGDPGGGDRILVARTTQGMACVVLVPRPARPPVAPSPSASVAWQVPQAFCYWPSDVARGAIVLRRKAEGVPPNRSTLVFVADGARVTTGDGTPAVAIDGVNLWAVPRGAAREHRVVLDRTDGSRVTLLIDAVTRAPISRVFYAPLVLSPEDAARPTSVPDVHGLSPAAARQLILFARLTPGPLSATPAAPTPGTALDQNPAAGTEAPPQSQVGVTRAAPPGPGGTRHPVDLATPVTYRGPQWRTPRSGRVADLRGLVTVIRLVRTSADVRQSSVYFIRPTNVFTITATTTPPKGRTGTTSPPYGGAPAVVVDRGGALRKALGVTSLPATVVLDRNARVAYRTAGLPPESDPALSGALDALPYESAIGAPGLPRNLASYWYLRGTSAPSRTVDPTNQWDVPGNRTRTFGTSQSGGYVMVSVGRIAPGVWSVSFGSTHDLSLGIGASFSTQGDVPLASLQRQHAVKVMQETVRGRGEVVYLVRPGYTRAIVNGRSIPIRNQVLTVRGRLPDGPVTLVGPQGKVPLDSTGVPR